MFIVYKVKKQIYSLALYVVTGFTCVIVAFPFYWLLITSIKHGKHIFTFPPIFIPLSVSIQSYVDIFQITGILPFFVNSCLISLSSVVLAVFIGSMAAYSLAKTYLSSRVRIALIVFVLLCKMFPSITLIIPYFIIVKSVGLLDTRIALIITYVAHCLPFTIWLMIGFFQDISASIEEAAIMEGCSFRQRFFQVVLPLVLPGLVVTAVFTFMLAWNEFLYASILTSFKAKTLPVVIGTFVGDQYLQWDKMSAMGVLMVLPVIIFASFIQRYLIRGMTFGAVKG